MKPHLMYRDRDFDSEAALRNRHEDLTQDLELNTLFTAMAKKDQFLFDISKQVILTGLDNIDSIKYRQDILRDCLENAEIVREIYQLTLIAKQNKHRRWLGIYARNPRGILSSAVQMMLMFSELLKELKTISDKYAKNFSSEGFVTFFTMIGNELDQAYLMEIDDHLKALQFKNGMLASVNLGKGNEGDAYTLRLPKKGSTSWIRAIVGRLSNTSPEHSFVIPSNDESGHRTLSELIDRSVRDAAEALAKSANHVDNFFKNLQNELAFYLGCLNLADKLKDLNSPISFPVVHPAHHKVHDFQELYDVCLALTINEEVVGNTVNASGKEMIIITGANQGGKSTFLRSVGLAQLMMEAGMYVPAEHFEANISDGVFTHYKREEDTTMKSGKLDEELVRMSKIVDQLSSHALVLFNESFSSTNESEGSEIARQITQALIDSHIMVAFVTHMYTFAHAYYEESRPDFVFLRAEREPDGSRTFKLTEGAPLETSFGKDIFNQVFCEDN